MVSSEKNRKRLSLLASFNLSLRQLSPEQLQQFAWFGVLPEDVMITQEMTATLWKVMPRQAGAILRTFWAKALLLPGKKQPDQKPTYRLHDLMHDLAKSLLTKASSPYENRRETYLPGLGLTLPDAHAALLELYRLKAAQGQWHSLPDDGYIHAHLTWHLEQSGQLEVLHQLLQESTPEGHNGWYEACEKLGQTGNFVTDVARAWQLAEQQYEQEPAESIALQFRYTLITTSLNSLAKNIPPALMAALVEKGVWTPAQGLAYAQQAQEPYQRAAAVQALAPFLPLNILPRAVEIAHSIENRYHLAVTLGSLITYLPEVAPEALQLTKSIQDEADRARALSSLVPCLPQVLLPNVLQLVKSIQHEDGRARVLSSLVPCLPQVLLPNVLQLVKSYSKPSRHEYYSDRVRVLSNLIAHLPEVAPEALELTKSIQYEEDRARALSNLVPCLPQALLPEALELTKSIQHEDGRARVLSSLVPCLPQALLPNVLQLAKSFKNKSNRVRVLSSLSLYLPEAAPEALQLAKSIQDEDSRARVLSSLVPCLPQALLPNVLQLAKSSKNKSNQVRVLSSLALYLPEAVPEALQLAKSIQDEPDHAHLLRRLAPYLSKETLPQALRLIDSIQSQSSRAYTLRGLAPYLPKESLLEALQIARSIQDKPDHVAALCGLALYLPAVLPEALQLARSLESESDQVRSLCNLVPYLPEIIPEVLQLARSLKSESDRATALSSLAPYLPQELLSEALQLAYSMEYESNLVQTLESLAPYLPKTLFTKASKYLLARAQKKLIKTPRLSNKLPSNNLLSDELLSNALLVAHSIQDEHLRSKELCNLLDRFDLTTISVQLWCELLHALSLLDRPDFIRSIPKLSPGILALGSSQALDGIVRVLREVCRQWK